MASEYRNFVRFVLNKELPAGLGVNFIHWDMKEKKRDKTKRYEIDMLQHAKKMIGQTGIFSSTPIKLLSYEERQKD